MSHRTFRPLSVMALVTAAFVIFAVSARAAMPSGHVYPAMDTAASTADYSKTPQRTSYVILQAWETKRLKELKAANPSVKVLVYKNLAFSGPASSGGNSTGVSTSEAADGWYLKNSSGQRFVSEGYNWLWAMDVGNPEYQKKWAENVVNELGAKGWDGVFIDDCNATMKYAYEPSRVAKYPNDSTYSAAMESAVSYIGPRITASGKLAIANFATWVEYPDTYNRWLGYLSGALDEMFVKWGRGAGEGYRDQWQWEQQVEEAQFAAAQGKSFLAFTQGSKGDTQAARYGYASLLLGGDSQASYAFTPNYTSESWLPEYEYDLGKATGAMSAESSGVHRRAFERGLVLVNPTSSTRAVTFGGTYSGSGLTEATGASMPPHSALVLTGTPSPAAPPTPPVTPPVKTQPPAEPAPVQPIPVTVAVGDNEANLAWQQPKQTKVKTYKVIRNSRSVARTSRLRRVEKGFANGRIYRLQVVGVDRRGHVVARSRLIRVRGSNGRKHIVVQGSSRRA